MVAMKGQPGAHDATWAMLGKLVKFSAVGASGVAVNTVVLFALFQLASVPLLVASPLATEIAIANNFIWNDYWTFGWGLGLQSDTVRRFLKFNLVSLGGLAITTGVLYELVTRLGWHYLFANLVGIGLATLWNFVLNSVWTWRESV